MEQETKATTLAFGRIIDGYRKLLLHDMTVHPGNSMQSVQDVAANYGTLYHDVLFLHMLHAEIQLDQLHADEAHHAENAPSRLDVALLWAIVRAIQRSQVMSHEGSGIKWINSQMVRGRFEAAFTRLERLDRLIDSAFRGRERKEWLNEALHHQRIEQLFDELSNQDGQREPLQDWRLNQHIERFFGELSYQDGLASEREPLRDWSSRIEQVATNVFGHCPFSSDGQLS